MMRDASEIGAKDKGSDVAAPVAILAGGESRRMGRDKAQLSWGGVSWLEHAARTALGAASRVAVVGRKRPADWPLEEVVFLEDDSPGCGPLGGLFTALSWVESQSQNDDRLLLLACDMPLLRADGLRWLFEAAARRQLGRGLAVRNGERIEPLFSIYTTACRPLVERRLRHPAEFPGRRSLHALVEAAQFEIIAAPPEIAATLANLNTPEDWKALAAGGGTTP